MVEPDAPNAARRIDAAIERIERAVASHTAATSVMERRHAALKTRMAEAVAALDDVLSRGSVG